MADERAVALDRRIFLFISSKSESSPVAPVDSMLRNRLILCHLCLDDMARLILLAR
jgi:hypothetical protein